MYIPYSPHAIGTLAILLAMVDGLINEKMTTKFPHIDLYSSVYNSSYDTTSRRRSERWLHPVQKQQLQPPPAKVSRDNG
jgi:hypothetical protein